MSKVTGLVTSGTRIHKQAELVSRTSALSPSISIPPQVSFDRQSDYMQLAAVINNAAVNIFSQASLGSVSPLLKKHWENETAEFIILLRIPVNSPRPLLQSF